MSKALENMSFDKLLEESKRLQTESQYFQTEAQRLQIEKQHLQIEKQGLQSDVQHLQFRIDQLNRLLFGAKRERFISNEDQNQLTLPFDIPQEDDITLIIVKKLPKGKKRRNPVQLTLSKGRKHDQEKENKWKWGAEKMH